MVERFEYTVLLWALAVPFPIEGKVEFTAAFPMPKLP
jgi:hypothetical protein